MHSPSTGQWSYRIYKLRIPAFPAHVHRDKSNNVTCDGCGGQRPKHRPLNPRERDPVPIVQEARWAPRSVWTHMYSKATIGVRTSNRPPHSGSIFRARGHRIDLVVWIWSTCVPVEELYKCDQCRYISRISVWCSHWFLITSVVLSPWMRPPYSLQLNYVFIGCGSLHINTSTNCTAGTTHLLWSCKHQSEQLGEMRQHYGIYPNTCPPTIHVLLPQKRREGACRKITQLPHRNH